MIPYLFKSIVCMAGFLLVYILFLEKEKIHRFNRWYLLGSIIFAYIVPLITIILPEHAFPILQNTYQLIARTTNHTVDSVTILTPVPKRESDSQLIFVIFTYTLITCFFLLRFTRNIYRLLSTVSKNRSIPYKGARLVLLKHQTVSYSFLNNIFISEADYINQNTEQKLITHELTHVQQKHSLDVIFIELLQAISWFNPILFFYKKAIRLNHEFLADDAVIRAHEDIPAYQLLLLEKICLHSTITIASPFNYSVTKKRLLMMTKTTNHAKAVFKKLAVVPVLAGALFVFSGRIIAQGTLPEIANRMLKNVPATKEGISKDQFDDYRLIEQRNIAVNKKGFEMLKWKSVTDEDRDRMETLFKKMNREQQSQVSIVFTPPIPPSKKEIPTQDLLNSWKKSAVYGVWIDDKRINNDALSNYKPADFSYYDASRLSKNAINYGKHYVQIDIMTNSFYDSYVKKTLAVKRYTMFFWSKTNAELHKKISEKRKADTE